MNNMRRGIKDLNMLSAYLDNALSAKDVEKLELRIKQNPELREKLENLRRTKLLISRLDRVHAPRNYTLKPDMVKVRQRKKQSLFVTLRLTTSISAILLVSLFGVQLLFQGLLEPTRILSEAPMMEAAHVEDEATPEPLIFWAQPGMGGADAEGYGGGAADIMEESYILEEPLPEEAPEEPAEDEIHPEEQPESLPGEEVSPQEYPEDDRGLPSKNLEDLSPILGVNPEKSGVILQRSTPKAEEQDQPTPWSKVIKWAQVGLAVVAVVGAFLLLILRNKRFY